MKKFSWFLNRFEKAYYTLVTALFISTLLFSNAFADDPKLVTGTVALFKAISGWLTLIIPVSAGAVLGWQALQKSLTDDHAIIAEKNKMMKNVLIGAVIATSATGLTTVVLGFYQ